MHDPKPVAATASAPRARRAKGARLYRTFSDTTKYSTGDIVCFRNRLWERVPSIDSPSNMDAPDHSGWCPLTNGHEDRLRKSTACINETKSQQHQMYQCVVCTAAECETKTHMLPCAHSWCAMARHLCERCERDIIQRDVTPKEVQRFKGRLCHLCTATKEVTAMRSQ